MVAINVSKYFMKGNNFIVMQNIHRWQINLHMLLLCEGINITMGRPYLFSHNNNISVPVTNPDHINKCMHGNRHHTNSGHWTWPVSNFKPATQITFHCIRLLLFCSGDIYTGSYLIVCPVPFAKWASHGKMPFVFLSVSFLADKNVVCICSNCSLSLRHHVSCQVKVQYLHIIHDMPQ